MNIICLLTPKASTGWIYDDFSLRQAVEKMTYYGFSAMPIVTGDGKFVGILNHTDILSQMRKKQIIKNSDLEKSYIREIEETKQRKAIKCNATEEELIELIKFQNFIPVTDDLDTYIGIITRRSVIEYLYNNNKKERK